jgi:hypothetical protein
MGFNNDLVRYLSCIRKPLKEYGYIISYEEDEGLKELKRVPKKARHIESGVI